MSQGESTQQQIPIEMSFQESFQRFHRAKSEHLLSVPVFRPTREQFMENPIEYVESIRKQCESYGICKIVTPQHVWGIPTNLSSIMNRDEFSFRTRLQPIHKLKHRQTTTARTSGDIPTTVESREFLSTLQVLHSRDLRKKKCKAPRMAGQVVNLLNLYRAVHDSGGFTYVSENRMWTGIARLLQIPEHCTSAAFSLRKHYQQLMKPYEKSQELTAFLKRECATCGGESTNISMCGRCGLSFHSECAKWHKLPRRVPICETCQGSDYQSGSTDDGDGEDEEVAEGSDDEQSDFGFDDSDQKISLRDFKHMADKFRKEYCKEHLNTESPSVDELEAEYWRRIEMPQKPLTVEYGNDLPATEYGTAFPKEPAHGCDHPWNILNWPNILANLCGTLPGLSVPFLYTGMMFSTFCWHTEDNWLNSLNYMHTGATKRWYSVPGHAAPQLEASARKRVPAIFENNPGAFHDIVTMISPLELIEDGVPVYFCDQNPGDFIITFPRCYHGGFSSGFNFSESVNFAAPHWFPWARRSERAYSLVGRRPTFQIDELVVETSVRCSFETSFAGPMCKELSRVIKAQERIRDGLSVEVAVRHPDFVSGDPKKCKTCQLNLYLSGFKCNCARDYFCVDHKECKCDLSNSRMHVRFTMQEMKQTLARIEANYGIQSHSWAPKQAEVIDVENFRATKRAKVEHAVPQQQQQHQRFPPTHGLVPPMPQHVPTHIPPTRLPSILSHAFFAARAPMPYSAPLPLGQSPLYIGGDRAMSPHNPHPSCPCPSCQRRFGRYGSSSRQPGPHEVIDLS